MVNSASAIPVALVVYVGMPMEVAVLSVKKSMMPSPGEPVIVESNINSYLELEDSLDLLHAEQVKHYSAEPVLDPLSL